MRLLCFYVQGFRRSDLFLKILLVLFILMWVYNLAYPKTPTMPSSTLEDILAYGFLVCMIIASVGLFLALESKGEEIEWSGCESPESRALMTKLLVRGGIIVCLIVGLI